MPPAAAIPHHPPPLLARLPELLQFAALAARAGDHTPVQWLHLADAPAPGRTGQPSAATAHPCANAAHAADAASLPVHALCLGNPDPAVPALALVGGVHGLERVGSQVVLAWLERFVARLAQGDAATHGLLDRLRLVVMPLVNPVGLALGTRSNGRGVDLMRNAPVQAATGALPLVGGHRLGRWLPWYRGTAQAALEPEAEALCRLVREQLLPHRLALALDCHSGFGRVDRLWFPWAHRHEPAPHLAEFHALGQALVQRGAAAHPAPAEAQDARPRHRRRGGWHVEPQNLRYLAHGDLWDHLYRESLAAPAPGPEPLVRSTLLPLTLEIGSWRWGLRAPRQLLRAAGLFNPPAARLPGVLRRHAAGIEQLVQLAAAPAQWQPQAGARDHHHAEALSRWYGSGMPDRRLPSAALPAPSASSASSALSATCAAPAPSTPPLAGAPATRLPRARA